MTADLVKLVLTAGIGFIGAFIAARVKIGELEKGFELKIDELEKGFELDQRKREREEQAKTQLQYLNPLRVAAGDLQLRLNDADGRIRENDSLLADTVQELAERRVSPMKSLRSCQSPKRSSTTPRWTFGGNCNPDSRKRSERRSTRPCSPERTSRRRGRRRSSPQRPRRGMSRRPDPGSRGRHRERPRRALRSGRGGRLRRQRHRSEARPTLAAAQGARRRRTEARGRVSRSNRGRDDLLRGAGRAR